MVRLRDASENELLERLDDVNSLRGLDWWYLAEMRMMKKVRRGRVEHDAFSFLFETLPNPSSDYSLPLRMNS